MRLGVVPQNIVERALLTLGAAPTPMFDTMVSVLLARTIMVATKIGIFEALAPGAQRGEDVAQVCGLDARAAEKFLNALVACGYLLLSHGRYRLAPVARRWLLEASPRSLHDNLLLRFLEWDIIEHYEEFVRTGKPLDVHTSFGTEEEWALYQRGMRSLAAPSANEVARRTPVPTGARDMLDVGGSHGYHSVVLCRRHRRLRSVILDLPVAVRHAAPILAKEQMGERVTHRPGNALTDDLGADAWDLVFVAYLVHHFDEATNRTLAQRIARALRPGGVFVIQELIRPSSPQAAGQPGALLDLYFAVTSQSGTWSFEEMA